MANSKKVITTKVEVDTSGASKSVGELRNELSTVSPAAKKASDATKMFNSALDVLKANPIIAVITLLTGLVIALFQPFKKMEAVSDSLNKAFGALSGAFNTFLTKILTPLIEGFVKLVDVITNSVIFVLEKLNITSKDTAKRFGDIADALDDLEDAERNQAIALAESNRKLQEAREIAADANLPIKDRISALKEAAKIEKEELDKVVAYNKKKASLMMEAIAMEMGARSGLIAKIKEGTLEGLKAARMELASMKNVNKDKLYEIDQMIIAADSAGAQSAKIAKKTQSQITGLEKEEIAKRKAAHDEAVKKQEELDRKKLEDEKKYLEQLNKEYEAYLKRRQYAQKNAFSISQDDFAKQEEEKVKAEKDARTKKTDEDLVWQQAALANRTTNLGIEYEQDKTATEAKIRLAEEERNMRVNASLDIADAMISLGSIVGEQTAAGKALGIASALINTYIGASEVIRAKSVLPEPFGTIQKIASVASIIATGLKTVKSIASVQVPGGAGGGAGAGSAPNISAPLSPEASVTTLNQAQVNQIGNVASKSYVVESDVSGNQERIRRLNRAARIS
jgi:hypothetical protein